jgi:glycerol kinase
MSYILSIDQSTSLTKVLLFNEKGEVEGRFDLSHKQYINDKGWIEHDMEEIYSNLIKAVQGLLLKTNIDSSQIKVGAITNQRETTVAFNKKTGESICPAIVWQCGRAKEICEKLSDKASIIKSKTGMTLSPYFSAAKMNWICENVDEAKALAKKNELALSTVDAFLIYRLSGLKDFKTEYSNACRTQLFNINSLEWDSDLISYFKLDKSMLPEVCDSDSLFCYTDFEGIFDNPIPIHSVLGDSQSALFAQGGNSRGVVKATYGTGSSVMANIGSSCMVSDSLVTSIGWKINNKVNYVVEGNINYCGATTRWLINSLQILDNEKNASKIAQSVTSENNVYLVPAFSGLGAPYWDSNARAIICGMDLTTTKNEIIKAGEETIGYQINDILQLMKDENKLDLKSLKVDGGITKDEYVMQFQSDISNIEVNVASIEELSALGTALNAALNLHLIDESYFDKVNYKKSYFPKNISRDKKISGWKKAVESAKNQ